MRRSGIENHVVVHKSGNTDVMRQSHLKTKALVTQCCCCFVRRFLTKAAHTHAALLQLL